MIIVRLAEPRDIDGILALAKQASPGMTTLPPDRDALEEKINASVTSIQKEEGKPSDETYMLVMEDTENHSIIGTAGLIACLGFHDQFYSYKLNKVTHSCKEINKQVSVETLNLSNHFEGFAEVATLFLDKNYRKNGNGKLLSKSRYLFMAQFRNRFPENVMADLRGYLDKNGRSPFWDAIGKNFFDMSFEEADLFGAINGNQFIADLMPKQPIYVNLLPKQAQEVIGRPNDEGLAALAMLEKEGFRWHGHVDIFDGSRSIDTLIDQIATVKNSNEAKVKSSSSLENSSRFIISTGCLSSFTTCFSDAEVLADQSIVLPPETIEALNINTDESVRYYAV